MSFFINWCAVLYALVHLPLHNCLLATALTFNSTFYSQLAFAWGNFCYRVCVDLADQFILHLFVLSHSFMSTEFNVFLDEMHDQTTFCCVFLFVIHIKSQINHTEQTQEMSPRDTIVRFEIEIEIGYTWEHTIPKQSNCWSMNNDRHFDNITAWFDHGKLNMTLNCVLRAHRIVHGIRTRIKNQNKTQVGHIESRDSEHEKWSLFFFIAPIECVVWCIEYFLN